MVAERSGDLALASLGRHPRVVPPELQRPPEALDGTTEPFAERDLGSEAEHVQTTYHRDTDPWQASQHRFTRETTDED